MVTGYLPKKGIFSAGKPYLPNKGTVWKVDQNETDPNDHTAVRYKIKKKIFYK